MSSTILKRSAALLLGLDLSLEDGPTFLENRQLHLLENYLKSQELGLMKRLSILAKSVSKEGEAFTKNVGPEPDKPNADGKLMSEILIDDTWLGKRQLEPQDVWDHIMEVTDNNYQVQHQFQTNINSVVLIGRSEMYVHGKLNATPLSDAELLVWTKENNSRNSKPAKLHCQFDKKFPFFDQKTVQFVVSENNDEIQPAFFGTGFFVKEDIVATAGHVVEAMMKAHKEHNASLIVVQYYRLTGSSSVDLKLKRYDVVADDYNIKLGSSTDDSDWGYFRVKGKSEHWVTLRISANCGKEVYGLGHGLGLPLKMAWNGLLFQLNNDLFRCKLETFGGNSGSPIFDAHTHEAIGILSGTDSEDYQDIQLDKNGACTIFPKVYLNGYNGAVCTSVAPLIEDLFKKASTL